MEYMICFLGGAHSLLPRMWAEDCRSNSLVKVKNNHEHQTVLVRLNKPTHFLLRLADDLHPHTHTHTPSHTHAHTHTHTHTHCGDGLLQVLVSLEGSEKLCRHLNHLHTRRVNNQQRAHHTTVKSTLTTCESSEFVLVM